MRGGIWLVLHLDAKKRGSMEQQLVALARLAGARVAIHEHVALTPGPRERSLREATRALRGRALNWMADRRLAVSRFVADSVVVADRVPPARVEVVENGVDLARFTGEGGAAVRSELALVVPKQDPAALAAAIDRVLEDERLAAALGRASRRRAEERYSMEQYVDRMVAAYERLCLGLAKAAA